MRPDAIKILIVDDSESNLLAYEAILGELGETLIKTTSARQALRVLLNENIGVALVDVKMPEIDGFRLAEMIREHPRFRRLPIIFISAAHITDLDQVRGYERGAVEYVSVPVNPEILRAKVSVFAELQRATRRLEIVNSQLSALSNRLLHAQDFERRRIARELHDSLGQALSYAAMTLDSATRDAEGLPVADKIADARGVIEDSIQQVRSLSYMLHPPMLDEFGLRSALTSYLQELGKRSGIEVTGDFDPPKFPRLKYEVENAVFRIIQESLANVVRHSGATKASVLVAMRNRQLYASVLDNGKGFPRETVEFRPGGVGVGVSGMRQRAAELGGELQLRNTSDGAAVETVIPVESPSGA